MWKIIWPFIGILLGICGVIIGLRSKKRQGFSEKEKKIIEESGITLAEAEENRKHNANSQIRIALLVIILSVAIEIFFIMQVISS